MPQSLGAAIASLLRARERGLLGPARPRAPLGPWLGTADMAEWETPPDLLPLLMEHGWRSLNESGLGTIYLHASQVAYYAGTGTVLPESAGTDHLVGAAVGGAALTAAVLLAVLAVRGPSGEPADTGRLTWPVAEAVVFDPSRPELTRDPDLARAAVDGDAQTVWSPGTFTTADLDGGEGVGLLLDLGEVREVRGLELRLVRGGPDLAVYALDARPDVREGAAPLGAPLSVQRGVRSVQRMEFSPVEARWWLVWVTGASPTPAGTFTAEFADVHVLGPG